MKCIIDGVEVEALKLAVTLEAPSLEAMAIVREKLMRHPFNRNIVFVELRCGFNETRKTELLEISIQDTPSGQPTLDR